MTEKRCGTCVWFSPLRSEKAAEDRGVPWRGVCGWETPTELPVSYAIMTMNGYADGQNCPCWEPKEGDA